MAKVIFSQASVIHSVHRGGCAPDIALIVGGAPDFAPIFGGDIFLGGVILGGSSKFSGGVFLGGGSPPEYGQRSAGTHPTGMHSCCFRF